MGKDGINCVNIPFPPDAYDSDDDEETAQAAAMELMKSQSVGYMNAVSKMAENSIMINETNDQKPCDNGPS